MAKTPKAEKVDTRKETAKLTQEAKEIRGERVDLKSNIVEKLPQCKKVAFSDL